ncbi:hypothetical protein DL767_004953 [Monosporascus sp. MG133]|nr:hypothetical protein DL767_004953 [Monosporascus sp. MG133]
MVQVLLDLGAKSESGGSATHSPHSAFHCIGKSCAPLSRQLIHGAQCRRALKETISLLVNRGFNINDADADGYNPLLVALTDPDCEAYIIEELLSAGADATPITSDYDTNAAVIAARCCISRRYSVSCLRLVAPRVLDINALDRFKLSALHYAVVSGSNEAVRILAGVAGFDANLRTADGRHPMYFAALFDAKDVISTLVEVGADIDAATAHKTHGDSSGSDEKTSTVTTLMTAAMRRKTATASLLLKRMRAGEGLGWHHKRVTNRGNRRLRTLKARWREYSFY